MLERHTRRELNAHLLLDGQPRVVQVFHTFRGLLWVPASQGVSARQLEAEGFVEAWCNQSSLDSFMWNIAQSVRRRVFMLPLDHLAAEFAALMRQVVAGHCWGRWALAAAGGGGRGPLLGGGGCWPLLGSGRCACGVCRVAVNAFAGREYRALHDSCACYSHLHCTYQQHLKSCLVLLCRLRSSSGLTLRIRI